MTLSRPPDTTQPVLSTHAYINAILHSIYLLILQILALLHWIHRTTLFHITHLPSTFDSRIALPTACDVARDTAGVARLPAHIAIVYTPRTRRLARHRGARTGAAAADVPEWTRNVARIACWCAAAGIPLLTVYDARDAAMQIAAELERVGPRFFAAPSHMPTSYVYRKKGMGDATARARPAIQVCVSGNPVRHLSAQAEPRVKVNIISATDGRFAIVKAAQSLATAALTRTGNTSSHHACATGVEQCSCQQCRGPTHVTVDSLNAILTGNGLDEPNLVYVLTGMTDPLTLQGFPPWQIRLSEFWHVQGDGQLRYLDFIAGISRYACTRQRFGK
ncbi:hypothetical protein SeMB42_g02571 [Synchytrium endobioticum]|uniref:ditrans,polycis-polyprenyl diphosphate synthase [(2E,6E)-farnesyldiphosphate specific] n=1 Tax=Synchytrium endobioticum TaxID=286115 RepID=A0A507DDG2_9FUNG|nr:hypothetical protein SeMB42_g02571 [Synchytrium endobioticum]